MLDSYYMKRYDINSPEFCDYFSATVKELTQEQKERIPRDLRFKITRDENGGYKHSLYNVLQQLFILYRVFNKRIYIVVEDETNGLTVDDFLEVKDNIGESINDEQGKWLMAKGAFVLGSRELVESFHHMNLVSYSAAFNYLVKLRNIQNTKYHNQEEAIKYVANLISIYEGRKKLITRNTGITVPEWYVMLCFADGMEKAASWVYKDRYHHAYNSSRKQIAIAIKRLVEKGILHRYSKNKWAKYMLTPYGFDILYDILGKYVINH